MRQKYIAIILSVPLFVFELGCLLIFLQLEHLFPSTLEHSVSIFMGFPMIFGGIFYFMLAYEIYDDWHTDQGETRAIYKRKKQLKKLELEKQFLENKQKHDSKVQELKNKIKQIKNEMNPFEEGSFFHAKKNDKFSKSVKLCLTCKSLNHSEAMYCSQCGSVKFSNIIY